MEELDLPASPMAAGVARAFTSDFCRSASLGREVCDDAVLLVSELTGNAVLHARSAAHLRLDHTGSVLHVEVDDHCPDLPQLREASLDRTGGRGVLILDALAARWGVRPLTSPPGKSVWFELPTA